MDMLLADYPNELSIGHSEKDAFKLVTKSYSKGPDSTVIFELTYHYEYLGNFTLNITLDARNRTHLIQKLIFEKEFDIKNGKIFPV